LKPSVGPSTGKIINGLADGDPKYNADFTECTVPLRQGIAWNDGEPFTAADVVYTIEANIQYTGFNGHSFFVDNVASVTAEDDYTVKFVLKQANSRFHTTFLDRWGCTRIMPKHVFEKEEDPTLFTDNPYIGCGPYKLHSFDPNGFWTAWERREDWDKSPTGIMYGQPVPKYIIYQAFTNEGAQILSQLTHQLDVAELSADGLKALLAQSKTSRAYQPTFPFVVNNDPCITGILFNTARAPFDNVIPLGIGAGNGYRGVHQHRSRFLGHLEPGARPAPGTLSCGLHCADAGLAEGLHHRCGGWRDLCAL
jgi:peptide/nickel transport system substrate-binding protein